VISLGSGTPKNGKALDKALICHTKKRQSTGQSTGQSMGESIVSINKQVTKNKEQCLALFDEFKKRYPGTKRGLETEYNNFVKKHKDWYDILPLLTKAVEQQIKSREHKVKAGKFVPEWKNMSTWINNRCWEEVTEATKPPQPYVDEATGRVVYPEGFKVSQ
jgi:ubiquinone/menaquinone biosynthesis C-methylase UbiE